MKNFFPCISALSIIFLSVGCTESEQQKWAKKSDWNFMVNTCQLKGGTEKIASCNTQLAEEAASSEGNYAALYTFYGPQQVSMQIFLAPNHTYQREFAEKITRSHIAPIDYIKGSEPNTLSIVLHANGCDVTTNYRLAEPEKVYEQTVSAVGSSCGEDQRAVAEYGLKDGPKLQFFTRN
ncbi:hypothetical protein G6712_06095 [Polynucleobacter paneuropaeus]|nr:hypothetical protein [Polynucleobacter paneuropaeus]